MSAPDPHSPAPLEVRPATAGDLDALVETRVALFRELGKVPSEDGLGEFRAACRAALEPLLASGGARAWVAHDREGAVHGSTILLLYPRLPSPADLHDGEGYVLNVYVTPAHRGRGVASALVAAALAECRRLGLGRARLHATEEGRGVYERLGFRSRPDAMEARL